MTLDQKSLGAFHCTPSQLAWAMKKIITPSIWSQSSQAGVCSMIKKNLCNFEVAWLHGIEKNCPAVNPTVVDLEQNKTKSNIIMKSKINKLICKENNYVLEWMLIWGGHVNWLNTVIMYWHIIADYLSILWKSRRHVLASLMK